MGKKRNSKPDFDKEMDALLSSSPEDDKHLLPKETAETTNIAKPSGYSYPGKTPKTSKKKRADLSVQWNADNRSKSLDAMMDGMTRTARQTFNADSVFGSTEDFAQVVVGIPLGSLAFEYLTGNDVWPLSSLAQLSGRWGTCKSTLAYEIFRWFYEFGGRSVHLDTESKYNPQLCANVMRYGDDDRAVIYNRCESLEDWQRRLEFYVSQFKAGMLGTAAEPGPGKVIPVVFGVDSLKAASSEERQEKIKKRGHGERGFPIEALKNSDFLSGWKTELDYWPFSLILVNHLKEKTDDLGRTTEYTPGGELVSFLETYEIRTSLWSKRIANSQFEGVGVRLTCAKNSLAPTNRRVRTRFIWWTEMDEKGEPQQYHVWDWNWATVAMLHEIMTIHKGPEKGRLKNLGWSMDVKSPSADLECLASVPLLGMKKGEFLPWQEVGGMIHESQEVMTLLRKGLGIEVRRTMSLGDNYETIYRGEQAKMR
tara:strand:- start:5587 stop:7029 length:1443 start_codon:yes stop_codon:yes gene_type:complete